jgi:hypothetical protein
MKEKEEESLLLDCTGHIITSIIDIIYVIALLHMWFLACFICFVTMCTLALEHNQTDVVIHYILMMTMCFLSGC